MLFRLASFLIIVTLNAFSSVYAESDIKLRTFIDFQAGLTDDTTSWLDGGLGKTRFGGQNGDKQGILSLAEASLIASARLGLATHAKAHLKFDPEQTNVIDAVEAYVSYRPVSTSALQFKARAGVFFPPISLENEAIAWTSPYSISSSAINSWIAEELRTIGAETTISKRSTDDTLSFTAALYQSNDPTGSLLAWRGWALHDRKTGLFDRLPLPALPSIETGGSIDLQARWVEPFHEIDDRIGFYAGFDWNHDEIFQLKLLHYDNRANETAFDGNQYAWHTAFTSIGAAYTFENGTHLIMQWMQGDSLMGRMLSGDPVVYIDFSAAYALLSHRLDNQRFSLRLDQFGVTDLDPSVDDDNNDDGSSISLSYGLQLNRTQQLLVEGMQISSQHANRASIGLPVEVTETILQLSYRLIFH